MVSWERALPASSAAVETDAKSSPQPPFGHLPPQAGEGFFVIRCSARIDFKWIL